MKNPENGKSLFIFDNSGTLSFDGMAFPEINNLLKTLRERDGVLAVYSRALGDLDPSLREFFHPKLQIQCGEGPKTSGAKKIMEEAHKLHKIDFSKFPNRRFVIGDSNDDIRAGLAIKAHTVRLRKPARFDAPAELILPNLYDHANDLLHFISEKEKPHPISSRLVIPKYPSVRATQPKVSIFHPHRPEPRLPAA
jgi:hypothetical protein